MAAETACKRCDRAVYPPTNDYPFWHDSDTYLSMYCPDGECHEPDTKETND